nr:XF1762 family protein [Roseburia intestinalis]
MIAVPMELKEAQNFIDTHHRHHQAAHRDKFRIAAMEDGEIVGVVQVGRPVSCVLDDGNTLEVLRLCSDGTKNVCSFLYSRAARVAKEMGYARIITYILETESGASLKASGWRCEAVNVGGANWNVPSRPREVVATQLSLFPEKQKYPINEKKQRWSKQLN